MGFSERFPRWITAVIGITQLVLTGAIIGLELFSIYIDLVHGTIWVGLWTGLVFLPASLLMIFITFCCRGRCYAMTVLVWNIFSALCTIPIIYFDQYFLTNLCSCYLTDKICCAVGSIPSLSNNYTGAQAQCDLYSAAGSLSSFTCTKTPTDKLPYIKAQLASACAMFITCGVYVVLFLFACFGICFGH